jgi:hypothetical protein
VLVEVVVVVLVPVVAPEEVAPLVEVEVEVAPGTEATPDGPALGTGWKKTTRSNVGALAPQPCGEPFGPAGALEVFDTCELLKVTRVTPLIRRSWEISRATSSCDWVHPVSSKAGEVTALLSCPVPPPAAPPELAPGTTVPTSD